MPTFSHDSVGSLVIRITVLVADHPHFTHLMSTGAAKTWGGRLSLSLRLEHGLLGLSVGSGHNRCGREHQRGDSKTDALQRDGLFRDPPTMPTMRRSALKRPATT